MVVKKLQLASYKGPLLQQTHYCQILSNVKKVKIPGNCGGRPVASGFFFKYFLQIFDQKFKNRSHQNFHIKEKITSIFNGHVREFFSQKLLF